MNFSIFSLVFLQNGFAYLCIFALFFSGVLKVPNLRFESAQMTSSKRLFDKTTLFLRAVNKNNKLKPWYFWKSKAKSLFLLTTAVLDIYSFCPLFLHIYSLSLPQSTLARTWRLGSSFVGSTTKNGLTCVGLKTIETIGTIL